MPESDGPDLVDPHPNVLADVKSGSVTDAAQADAPADQTATAVLDDVTPDDVAPDAVAPDAVAVHDGQAVDDGQGEGPAPPEDAVEELRAVAEELREERERLEWTANQVAHLVEHRPGPSLDPDPTPPAPLDLQAVTVAAQQEASPGEPVVEDSETTDAEAEAVPAPRRRGGGLVTVLGVLMLILAAAVLVSRAVA